MMAFWLHTKTENAEYIVKFGHLVIHSLAICCVVKISYMYLPEEKPQDKENAELEKHKKTDSENDYEAVNNRILNDVEPVIPKRPVEYDDTLSARG